MVSPVSSVGSRLCLQGAAENVSHLELPSLEKNYVSFTSLGKFFNQWHNCVFGMFRWPKKLVIYRFPTGEYQNVSLQYLFRYIFGRTLYAAERQSCVKFSCQLAHEYGMSVGRSVYIPMYIIINTILSALFTDILTVFFTVPSAGWVTTRSFIVCLGFCWAIGAKLRSITVSWSLYACKRQCLFKDFAWYVAFYFKQIFSWKACQTFPYFVGVLAQRE